MIRKCARRACPNKVEYPAYFCPNDWDKIPLPVRSEIFEAHDIVDKTKLQFLIIKAQAYMQEKK